MKLWLGEKRFSSWMPGRALHSVCCGTFTEGLHTVIFNLQTIYSSFTVQTDANLIQ